MKKRPDLLKKIALVIQFLPWVFYFRAIIFLAPFTKIVAGMPINNKHDPTKKLTASEIRWTLRSIERHLPLISNCWSLAATGYRFALLNGYSAEIRMGIRKHQNDLKAHAWLICEDKIISGAKGHTTYTVTTILRPGQIITHLPPQETLPNGVIRFVNGEKP